MKSQGIWINWFVSVSLENTRKSEKKKSELIWKLQMFSGKKGILYFSSWTIVTFQGMMEKNDLGVDNVNKTTAGEILN